MNNASGHLIQGRYKGILVDADAYLLEWTRYVVLNPLRAGMVEDPGTSRWSSYNVMIGKASSPDWLATDGLLAQFAIRRHTAARRCMQFIAEGIDSESIWKDLNR